MSFGEPAARSSGFLRSVIDDAVLRYGVTFLASAGNAGPALQARDPALHPPNPTTSLLFASNLIWLS